MTVRINKNRPTGCRPRFLRPYVDEKAQSRLRRIPDLLGEPFRPLAAPFVAAPECPALGKDVTEEFGMLPSHVCGARSSTAVAAKQSLAGIGGHVPSLANPRQ